MCPIAIGPISPVTMGVSRVGERGKKSPNLRCNQTNTNSDTRHEGDVTKHRVRWQWERVCLSVLLVSSLSMLTVDRWLGGHATLPQPRVIRFNSSIHTALCLPVCRSYLPQLVDFMPFSGCFVPIACRVT